MMHLHSAPRKTNEGVRYMKRVILHSDMNAYV